MLRVEKSGLDELPLELPPVDSAVPAGGVHLPEVSDLSVREPPQERPRPRNAGTAR
jgi:hypothetical protein